MMLAWLLTRWWPVCACYCWLFNRCYSVPVKTTGLPVLPVTVHYSLDGDSFWWPKILPDLTGILMIHYRYCHWRWPKVTILFSRLMTEGYCVIHWRDGVDDPITGGIYLWCDHIGKPLSQYRYHDPRPGDDRPSFLFVILLAIEYMTIQYSGDDIVLYWYLLFLLPMTYSIHWEGIPVVTDDGIRYDCWPIDWVIPFYWPRPLFIREITITIVPF